MTDDIDNIPTTTTRRTSRTCPYCGMLLYGVTCGFCSGKKKEGEKKRWVGRER
jgi:hypothetical protein